MTTNYRPLIDAFGDEMERRLLRNTARGAIPRTDHDLLSDLQLCCIKLEHAIEAYRSGTVRGEFVEGEAADVANLALLLAARTTGRIDPNGGGAV